MENCLLPCCTSSRVLLWQVSNNHWPNFRMHNPFKYWQESNPLIVIHGQDTSLNITVIRKALLLPIRRCIPTDLYSDSFPLTPRELALLSPHPQNSPLAERKSKKLFRKWKMRFGDEKNSRDFCVSSKLSLVHDMDRIIWYLRFWYCCVHSFICFCVCVCVCVYQSKNEKNT